MNYPLHLAYVWGEADWVGGSRARKRLVFQARRLWWPPAGPKSVVTILFRFDH